MMIPTRRHALTLALLAAAAALPMVASGAEMIDGEVRKVDRDAGKITIKHGEIKSLDMPPMTMVFQVKSPALLDKVKAGDKARFAVEKTAGGAFVVTEIERQP
jgi:Cu(I)/Ag(I) efflux system periplasmic protein CusF